MTCEYRYAVFKVFTLLLVSRMVYGDRLDNNVQQPSASYSISTEGDKSYRHASGIGNYKNSYKSSSNTPTLLHKTSSPGVDNTNTEPHHVIPIVKQTFEPNSGDGSYAYSYETGNGISAFEYGTYIPGLTGEEGIQSASGSYSYTGPDNIIYTITYTAGLEGFVPQGAHLPTPPPTSETDQKVLQQTGGGESTHQYLNYNNLGTYQNEPNKYQLHGVGKYPATNEPNIGTHPPNRKYQSNDAAEKPSSNKYTAAVQIPYMGYRRNTSYGKSLNTNANNEYKVHDEFSK